MFRDLRLRHLAIAQLTSSRHSSSKLASALDLRQFRLAVRRADDFALDFSVHLHQVIIVVEQTDGGYNRRIWLKDVAIAEKELVLRLGKRRDLPFD